MSTPFTISQLQDTLISLCTKYQAPHEVRACITDTANPQRKSILHAFLSQAPLTDDDWTQLDTAMKHQFSAKTTLIANGDIEDVPTGKTQAIEAGFDGIMIGRGVFKNPYIFNKNYTIRDGDIIHIPTNTPLSIKSRLLLLREHLALWKKTWMNSQYEERYLDILQSHHCITQDMKQNVQLKPNHKHFAQLKKYIKIYISGFKGASDMRTRYMNTLTVDEAIALTDEILLQNHPQNSDAQE